MNERKEETPVINSSLTSQPTSLRTEELNAIVFPSRKGAGPEMAKPHFSPRTNALDLSAGPAFADFSSNGSDDFLFGRKMTKTLHWSIPWSDLMMMMFILFAVMYAYHAAFQDVPSTEIISEQADLAMTVPVTIDETPWEPRGDAIQKLYDLSNKTLDVEKLRSFASVNLVQDKAVRIILTGDFLFDTGKAELKEEAKVSLKKIAGILRKTPYMVNLVGHTDNIPIHTEQFPSNWELSTMRACQVARFLIEDMHIPAEKFFVSGHAFYEPIKANYGAKNRAANRRVEIIMTKEKPYAVPDSSGIYSSVL
ncbi:MAG: OmpA family protein [Deltaproteobacteria bacterium]|nr:OmpA family protein [Deltaproteobacteria bacterium]